MNDENKSYVCLRSIVQLGVFYLRSINNVTVFQQSAALQLSPCSVIPVLTSLGRKEYHN